MGGLSNFSNLLLALVAQGLANASQKAMLGHVRAKELDNNWQEFSVKGEALVWPWLEFSGKGEGICIFGEGIWWVGHLKIVSLQVQKLKWNVVSGLRNGT